MKLEDNLVDAETDAETVANPEVRTERSTGDFQPRDIYPRRRADVGDQGRDKLDRADGDATDSVEEGTSQDSSESITRFNLKTLTTITPTSMDVVNVSILIKIPFDSGPQKKHFCG